MKSLLAALILLPAMQDPAADKVGALIARLGADGVEDREQASRDLLALGPAVLPVLEKRFEGMPEGEPRVRVKAVMERLRRLVRAAEVAPKVRPVTVSAKDVPLRTLLADLTVQSGVAIECSDAVADSKVTIDIKAESALQAIDRICLANGDLTTTILDGKVKVIAGASARTPAAYVDGFRARLRRKVIVEAGDFAKSRVDIVLHATFDAQPDQQCKQAIVLPGPEGTSGAGPVKVRAASEIPLSAWLAASGKNIAIVDDVMIILEEGDSLDFAFFLKDVPATLKSLDSLKIKARFRYPVGVIPTTVPLTGRGRATMLGDLPYYLHMGGRSLYIYAAPRPGQPAVPPLPDLLDLETLTIVDSAGKENKLTSQPTRGGRSMQYQFQSERELKEEEMSLKFNLYDSFDREVEFELKDVRLRE